MVLLPTHLNQLCDAPHPLWSYKSPHVVVPTYFTYIHLPSPSIKLASLLLKLPIVCALTTCWLSLFQSSTILFVNQFLPISFINLHFFSLNPLLLVLSSSLYALSSSINSSQYKHTFHLLPYQYSTFLTSQLSFHSLKVENLPLVLVIRYPWG